MGAVPPEAGRTKAVFCFAVAPAYRRQGIAALLLARVCQDAAAEGFAAVEGYPNARFESTESDFMPDMFEGQQHRAAPKHIGQPLELAGERNFFRNLKFSVPGADLQFRRFLLLGPDRFGDDGRYDRFSGRHKKTWYTSPFLMRAIPFFQSNVSSARKEERNC